MVNAWIRTDETEDVAGSIRHALRMVPFLADDPQAWKWAMLALHSALQGACVCHLTTTAAPVGALTKQNTGEWLDFFERQRTDPAAQPPSKTHLLNLPDLLKAVCKAHSAGDRSNAAGVAISGAELAWLKRIHGEVRNQFIHFEPMGWSIEVSGVPDLARVIARILTEMLEIGWAFRHLGDQGRAALRRDLEELTALEWPMPGPEAA
ncbi:MAG: hypothetical protein DI623_15540 [Sphingomonas sanxanigenens]|uniref:Uncharacterized protein n=1 Tax=Sphingomonas sanxanigenens TaxID=397260 RepID=A0A2W5A0W2_9SPHN|nr:MAG: hypothetical protein DI623_15540 [Sphingomonas sanxanigenens]